MASEEGLKQQLEELQKQLGKKQKFEDAVSSIKTLVRDFYPSASPTLRKSFYSVVCRVATILKTRYTAPGFWSAGLGLFQEAEGLVSDSSEKEHLMNSIAQAKEHLHFTENPPEVSSSSSRGGYLFEGHLTVDPEPPRPLLGRPDLISSVASLLTAGSSRGPVNDSNTTEAASNLQDLVASLLTGGSSRGLVNDSNITEAVSNLLEQLTSNFDTEIVDSKIPKVPPASKEVVAKLPVITLTEEILAKPGEDGECAICKENLVVNDKMQELPCEHTFHPPCLKQWLDMHNSCPICRHELQTDDHVYESWKERKKEAEEERKGAANAVRGGEFLYI